MFFNSWLQNRKRSTAAARRYTRCGTLAGLALLLLALVAPAVADSGDDGRAPDVSAYLSLQVPEGNKLVFHAYAEGVQIYRWNGSSWVFVAPEATLYADAGYDGVVGIHYAGPTWESVSGSLVVGKKMGSATPDPDAIPWLLLEAVHTEGPGIFHHVTFIQRLYTEGGTAPTYAGESVGEEARVPYAAEYFFYRADD